jgi:hypothetical protein
MSYRRKRDDAQELRRYKAFCLNNSTLIDQVGLPSFVVEDYNAFMYVLMHGETWSDMNSLSTQCIHCVYKIRVCR